MTAQRIRENFTAEHVLLLFFLGVSVYMFVESYSLSDRAAAFPRFTAGATIVGVSLLLVRSYLPGPLGTLVSDADSAFDDVSDASDDLEEEPDALAEETEAETRYVDLKWVSVHGSLFTGGLTALFVLGSYLIGMLWVAPLFAAAYLAGLRRPLPVTAGMAALSFVAAFSFYYVLGIGIAGGVLLDLEWLVEPLAAVVAEIVSGVSGTLAVWGKPI